MTEEDQDKAKLMFFGRDLAKIPCFRSSFIYGISGGIGTGLVFFMFTSKSRLATHVGFSSFMGITMSYWFFCRYQWSKNRFNIGQLQAGMQKQAMFEGTKIEEQLKEKSPTKS